ncbi:hypothetical protein T4C_5780 [Trichinella pseudospiralis]|uniref:Uncharacterized protein n=1 Tax=Trichinella pseudospiralis TaxID=6337 RepID=A0A0V1JDA9_TRIPS|nr:hypothetical protein T4C_5780 [Trichinella pseudospiralis]
MTPSLDKILITCILLISGGFYKILQNLVLLAPSENLSVVETSNFDFENSVIHETVTSFWQSLKSSGILRCPLEILQIVSAIVDPQYPDAGDGCTLGAYLLPHSNPKMYLKCIPRQSENINVKLKYLITLGTTLSKFMTAIKEGPESVADNQSVKDTAIKLLKNKAAGWFGNAKIPLPRYLHFPGIHKCGELEAVRCTPGTVFNFFNQSCSTGITNSMENLQFFLRNIQKIKDINKYITSTEARKLLPDLSHVVLAIAGNSTFGSLANLWHKFKTANQNVTFGMIFQHIVSEQIDFTKLINYDKEQTLQMYKNLASILGLYNILTGNVQPYTVTTRMMMDYAHGTVNLLFTQLPSPDKILKKINRRFEEKLT